MARSASPQLAAFATTLPSEVAQIFALSAALHALALSSLSCDAHRRRELQPRRHAAHRSLKRPPLAARQGNRGCLAIACLALHRLRPRGRGRGFRDGHHRLWNTSDGRHASSTSPTAHPSSWPAMRPHEACRRCHASTTSSWRPPARTDLSSMRHRPASRAPAAAIASILEHRVPAAAAAPSAATPSPKNLRVTDALKRANDQRIEDAAPTKNQSSMGMDAARSSFLRSRRGSEEAERAARRGGHVPGAAPPRTPEWGSTRTSSHAPLQASSLPSSLKASAPVWWSMPKNAFDKRHETRKVAAEKLLTSLRTEQTITKDQLFDRARDL